MTLTPGEIIDEWHYRRHKRRVWEDRCRAQWLEAESENSLRSWAKLMDEMGHDDATQYLEALMEERQYSLRILTITLGVLIGTVVLILAIAWSTTREDVTMQTCLEKGHGPEQCDILQRTNTKR